MFIVSILGLAPARSLWNTNWSHPASTARRRPSLGVPRFGTCVVDRVFAALTTRNWSMSSSSWKYTTLRPVRRPESLGAWNAGPVTTFVTVLSFEITDLRPLR